MSTRHSTFPASSSERALEKNKYARDVFERSGHSKRGLRAQADSVQIPSSLPGITRHPNTHQTGHPHVGFDPAGSRARVSARDLMTICAETLRPEDSIERAAALMSETHDGSVPVVDGAGRLIGMMTHRDITAKLVALGASIPHAQVSDCMTRDAFACSADSSIESCVSAMAWHQVKQLPIVDDEHRILGMISRNELACYICDNPPRTEDGAMADILWALAF